MNLCAETYMIFRPGNFKDGGWFPQALVKSNEHVKTSIAKTLQNAMGKKKRKFRGRWLDLVRLLQKDSEAKTRRIIKANEKFISDELDARGLESRKSREGEEVAD